jgi:hypothetical protein
MSLYVTKVTELRGPESRSHFLLTAVRSFRTHQHIECELPGQRNWNRRQSCDGSKQRSWLVFELCPFVIVENTGDRVWYLTANLTALLPGPVIELNELPSRTFQELIA